MPLAQLLFLGFALLILLFQGIKGWRYGLVHQLVRFGALAAAYGAAIWGGGAAGLFLRPLGYPDVVLRCLGGAALGTVVYLLLNIAGNILFKRTGHQESWLVRLVYGSGGALLGAAFALVLVVACADVIRLLGSIAEGDAGRKKEPMNTRLAAAKEAVEGGALGGALKTLDPAPRRAYAIALKMGRTLSSGPAMERFLKFPGAKELAENADIRALSQDAEVRLLLRQFKWLELLKNEKVVKVANDPALAETLRTFELEKALDQALRHSEAER